MKLFKKLFITFLLSAFMLSSVSTAFAAISPYDELINDLKNIEEEIHSVGQTTDITSYLATTKKLLSLSEKIHDLIFDDQQQTILENLNYTQYINLTTYIGTLRVVSNFYFDKFSSSQNMNTRQQESNKLFDKCLELINKIYNSSNTSGWKKIEKRLNDESNFANGNKPDFTLNNQGEFVFDAGQVIQDKPYRGYHYKKIDLDSNDDFELTFNTKLETGNTDSNLVYLCLEDRLESSYSAIASSNKDSFCFLISSGRSWWTSLYGPNNGGPGYQLIKGRVPGKHREDYYDVFDKYLGNNSYGYKYTPNVEYKINMSRKGNILSNSIYDTRNNELVYHWKLKDDQNVQYKYLSVNMGNYDDNDNYGSPGPIGKIWNINLNNDANDQEIKPPFNVKLKQVDSQKNTWNLSWQNHNANKFKVYRSIDNGEFKPFKTTINKNIEIVLNNKFYPVKPVNSYISNQQYNKNYCYYVTGLRDEQESKPSEKVCIDNDINKKLPDLIINEVNITPSNNNKKFDIELSVENKNSVDAYSKYDLVRLRVYINGKDHGFESLPVSKNKLFLRSNEKKIIKTVIDYSNPVNWSSYDNKFQDGINIFEFGLDKAYLKGQEKIGYIKESNENNNSLTKKIYIDLDDNEEGLPDLVVKGIDVEQNTGLINAKICNIGKSAHKGSLYVRAKHNNNGSGTSTSDTYVLNAGECDTLMLIFSQGPYQINQNDKVIIEVDPENKIKESNENNNIFVEIIDYGMEESDNEYFTDVNTTDWVYPYALKLLKSEIISGDTLNPNKTKNRVEAVKLLIAGYEFMNGEITDTTNHEFNDIPTDHWAHELLQKALSEDIIADNDNFYPLGNITRAQFSKIVATSFFFDDIEELEGNYNIFNDVTSNHWAAKYIALMKELGLISGYSNGDFGPENKVTKAETIKILVNAMEYVDNDIFDGDIYEEI